MAQKSKKDFMPEFETLLGTTTPAQQEAAKRVVEKIAGTSTNAQAQEQRCTFILPAELLNRLRSAAYAETGKQGRRVLIKDVLTAALTDYLTKQGY